MIAERCANCDSEIGKLETANIFNDQVVCSRCQARLNSDLTLKKNTDAVISRVLIVLGVIVGIIFCLWMILHEVETIPFAY
jgi:predicted nucleic acid-binding Zn ribbon protein